MYINSKPTTEKTQPPPNFCQQCDTLQYVYCALTPQSNRHYDHLQSFRPTVGQLVDGKELREINNPQ